jgi:large subunit ribosomal protein L21
MQAVITSGSSQYLVTPGQELLVNKLNHQDKTVVFQEVLLFTDEGKTLVGTPFLAGYSVSAEILDLVKGEKIRVFKYKAKSRYRKHVGFRAQLSKIKILSIDTPETVKSKPEVKLTSETAPAPAPKASAVKKSVKKPAAAKKQK